MKKPPDSIKPGTGIFSVSKYYQNLLQIRHRRIQINPEIPEGLIYRIQMAVFKNPVSPSFLKELLQSLDLKGQMQLRPLIMLACSAGRLMPLRLSRLLNQKASKIPLLSPSCRANRFHLTGLQFLKRNGRISHFSACRKCSR